MNLNSKFLDLGFLNKSNSLKEEK